MSRLARSFDTRVRRRSVPRQHTSARLFYAQPLNTRCNGTTSFQAQTNLWKTQPAQGFQLDKGHRELLQNVQFPGLQMRSNLLEALEPDLDFFAPHSPPIAIVDLATELIGRCETYGDRNCTLDSVDERRPGVLAPQHDRASPVQGVI